MGKRNPIKGPGKYEGELFLTRRVFEDGSFDDEIGDVENFGWYGLFNGLTIKGQGPFYGIISENNQGFVSGAWYKTEKEMKDKWDEIIQAYDEFMDDEEEEKGD